MYKSFFAIILLFLFALKSKGQNFVSNNGFERTGDCPITSTDFQVFLNPWDTAFGDVDYYHLSCGDPGSSSTTNNTPPFDGEGFIGLFAYGTLPNGRANREYIYSELNAPLDSGKLYRLSFYVKPVFDDIRKIGYGANNIGAAVTPSAFDSIPSLGFYHYEPQVAADEPIITLNSWNPICGVFMSRGDERYITIGNFKSDSQTIVIPLVDTIAISSQAYYLVDYVALVENDLPQLPKDTIICENHRIDIKLNAPNFIVIWPDESIGTEYLITEPGIYYATIRNPACSYTDTILIEPAFCEDCNLYIPNAFTPNGDGLNERFELNTNCDLISYRINIFDRWGIKVFESDNINVSWDASDVDHQGVFSYVVEYEFELLRGTRVLMERGVVVVVK